MKQERWSVSQLRPADVAGAAFGGVLTVAWLAIVTFTLIYSGPADAAEGGVAGLDGGQSRETARLGNDVSDERSASYSSRWRDYSHDRFDERGWNSSPGKLKISFGGRYGDTYFFASFGQALRALDRRDEWPSYQRIAVLDFASYGKRKQRWLDAENAYFILGSDWNEGFGRDDLPVLAFRSQRDARRWQRELGGSITDFYGVMDAAFLWADDNCWHGGGDDWGNDWDNGWSGQDRCDSCGYSNCCCNSGGHGWHGRDRNHGRSRR